MRIATKRLTPSGGVKKPMTGEFAIGSALPLLEGFA
jgi:hypothetical protein